jgi:hypothetical protein
VAELASTSRDDRGLGQGALAQGGGSATLSAAACPRVPHSRCSFSRSIQCSARASLPRLCVWMRGKNFMVESRVTGSGEC